MPSNLVDRHAVPLKKGEPKLEPQRVQSLLGELPGWQAEGDRLRKLFKFKDFVKAMAFLNSVAQIAESEQHHPDFAVHYNEVDFTIWTHTVGGLSENDFILAAKIDRAAKS
jgi:4a-hydroxytetrahydrobiopterin dehydratase